MSRRGLTLVEVLVVTAILVVLAGIGFALTPGLRENARQGVCAQNLKQIYTALQLYAGDYEGGASELQAGPVMFTCGGSLDPYLKVKDVLHCPTATPRMQQLFYSTYMLAFNACPGRPTAGPKWIKPDPSQRTAEQILGPRQALATCQIHDELVYGPQEAHIDPSMATPFIIHLRIDGSIWKGRDETRRRFLFFSTR